MDTVGRLPRYALFLAGYDHQIGYKNTKGHINADDLSRLTLKTKERAEKVVDTVNVFKMIQFDVLPITVEDVR